MLLYCHGVVRIILLLYLFELIIYNLQEGVSTKFKIIESVPVEFNRVTALWKKNDTIHVFKGGLKWEFNKKTSYRQLNIHPWRLD